MKPKSTLRSFLLGCSSLLVAHSAYAQQIYWLGTTDGNFNADNWTNVSGTAMVSSLVPVNNDVFNFDTSETSFNDVAGSFTVNNDLVGLTGLTLAITDNSATGDFNISGNAISLASGGISSNVLNGAGSTLTFSGTGITLDAASQFYANFGSLTINSDVDNGGNLLTVTGGGDTSITGAITGLGGLERTNSGSLTLSGTNSYGGGTTITNGTVSFSKLLSMPATGAVTVNTGTTLGIKLGGAGEWTTGTSGNGTLGGLLLGDGGQAGGTVGYSGNVTLGLATSSNQSYSGVIANVGTSLALRKTGSTQLELKGINTYSGGTVVAEGQVSAPGSTAGGSVSPLGSGLITLQSGTKLFLSRSDFTNAIDATDAEMSTGNSFGTVLPSDITVTGTVSLMSNNGSGNIDYTGDIDGTGGVISYGVRETNQLAVDLIGTNTFDGPASVASNANIGFVNRVSLPDTGAWTAANLTVNSGGIAYFYVGGGTQFTTADIDILAPLGTGSSGFLDGSFLGFYVTSNFSHNSVIADTNGGANKLGVAVHGGQTLTLGNSNTYTGRTLIRRGTVQVTSINSVVGGSASSSLGAPTNVDDGKIGIGGSYNTGTIKYVGTGETTDRIIQQVTYQGGQGDIILDQSGTGLLKFTSDMDYTAGGKFIRLQGSTAGEGEFAGRLGGNTNAKVEKSGSGKWTITGDNYHFGVTQLTGGVLRLTTPIQNGGFAPTVNTTSGSPDIVVSDATGLEVGMTVSSERVPLGSTIIGIAGTTVTLDNNAISTASGKASGIGYPGNLGLATNSPANLIWNNNATLQYDGVDCTTNRGFNVQNRVATLEVTQGSTTLTFTGDNAGTTGRIVKTGAGTLVLSGALVHTGSPNNIDEGTLLINGDASAMTGAVNVNGTATLGGTGTIGGNVVVAATANLEPGASAGTLTIVGDLNISAPAGDTGLLKFELDTVAASDKIVTGTLNIGTDVLNFSDFDFTALGGLQNGTYTLISSGAAPVGTLDPTPANLTGAVGAGTGILQITGNNLELVVSGIGGGSAYDAWEAINAPTTGNNPAADEDGDGVSNGLEFVLGGTIGANDLGKLPAAAASGGNMTFTFVRDQDSVDGSTLVTIEVGTDLAAWPTTFSVGADTGSSTAGVVVTDNLNGTDTVVLTVTQAPDAKKFARLKAVVTP